MTASFWPVLSLNRVKIIVNPGVKFFRFYRSLVTPLTLDIPIYDKRYAKTT